MMSLRNTLQLCVLAFAILLTFAAVFPATTLAQTPETATILLTKKFSGDFEGLTADQFKFSVETIPGEISLTQRTDDEADAVIELPVGTYKIEEIWPNGVIPDDSWRVKWDGFVCENVSDQNYTTITIEERNLTMGNIGCRADNIYTRPAEPVEVLGCTDETATNYNPLATDGNAEAANCAYEVLGCTDPTATNYNPDATPDNAEATECTYDSSEILGCTDPTATNYNPDATPDNADASNCTYDPIEVLGCTDSTATNYNPSATPGNADAQNCTYDNGGGGGGGSAPQCVAGVELIANGDFETPTVTNSAGWQIFPNNETGLEWMVAWRESNVLAPAVANIELHTGDWWPAATGDQFTELDSDWSGPGGRDRNPETASTILSQLIATIPGETYTLSWNFSPRPNTSEAENQLQVAIGGTVVASNSGAGSSAPDWQPASYTFVATNDETLIAFSDQGPANAEGTFLDTVSLECIPQIEPEEDTYRVEGYVWHDDNENSEWDGFESETEEQTTEESLAGQKVTITNGEDSFSTTTDENGFYYFEVPAGTWTISHETDGWDIITPVSGTHVVTVPEVIAASLGARVLAFFVPTAHAAVVGIVGPFNFGLNETETGGGTPGPSGGGGGGTKIELVDNNPGTGGGSVAGASDSSGDDAAEPVPQILGEQVSIVPAGAPNTGAGGTSGTTSPVYFVLLMFMAGLVAFSARRVHG